MVPVLGRNAGGLAVTSPRPTVPGHTLYWLIGSKHPPLEHGQRPEVRFPQATETPIIAVGNQQDQRDS